MFVFYIIVIERVYSQCDLLILYSMFNTTFRLSVHPYHYVQV